jgi:membrane-associated two-gene conflict system component 1 (EACC1)
MEARLELIGSDDPQDELSSLREWLAAESEFRGRVRLEQAPIRPGQMGGIADAVQVALDHDGALTVLAGSVAVWLRARRSKLKVKIVNSDGSSQEITASGPAADTLASKVDPHQHG